MTAAGNYDDHDTAAPDDTDDVGAVTVQSDRMDPLSLLKTNGTKDDPYPIKMTLDALCFHTMIAYAKARSCRVECAAALMQGHGGTNGKAMTAERELVVRGAWETWLEKAGVKPKDANAEWSEAKELASTKSYLETHVLTIIEEAWGDGWRPAKGVAGGAQIAFNERSGVPDAGDIHNVGIYLKHVGWVPAYNEFDRQTYVRLLGSGNPYDEAFDDVKLTRIVLEMNNAGCRVKPDLVRLHVIGTARDNAWHPVREYLDSLKWDGVPRLDNWLATYCGAERSRYHALVGPKWLVGAVRRVRQPGCKFDNVLVLEGPQYAGKSGVFRILGGEWFGDSLEIGDASREVIEKTQGHWIVECAELSGLSKRDVNEVKRMATIQFDKARGAYKHFAEGVPRQFVMGSTTNTSQYLVDDTGNRRFWSVATTGDMNHAALIADRDQLWAEAAHREALGERVYLAPDEYQITVVEAEKRMVADATSERLHELFEDVNHGMVRKQDVYEYLGINSEKDRAACQRVIVAMGKMGWEDARVRHGDEKPYVFLKGDKAMIEYNAVARAFKFPKEIGRKANG